MPLMNDTRRAAYETREAILGLLSNAELANVSMTESTASLASGEDYLDLQNLDLGVRQANRDPIFLGAILTRRSVHATTWTHILAKLAALPPVS